MTKDKRNSKEVNLVIEALEKRVDDLEKLVKCLLSPKVKELEESEATNGTKLDLQAKIHAKNDNIDEIKFKCKECTETFSDNDSLKLHIKAMHVKSFKCTTCDKTFVNMWTLENHLHKEHKTGKEFKCGICDKDFLLKWRLNQHVRGHSDIKQKSCHYFNNGKLCPFEEYGCKFRHAISSFCNFGKCCKNHLCQYRHDSLDERISVDPRDNLENNEVMEVTVNDKTPESQGYKAVEDNKELEEAFATVKVLEMNKIEMENKLKLYSATIRKMRSERKI